MTKQIISVLGLPGAGKSRLITALTSTSSCKILHVGKFSKVHGFADETARSRGELLSAPGLIEAFLEEVRAITGNLILDGFPRSTEQADQLLRLAASEQSQLKVILLTFPGGVEAQVEWSFQRQLQRALQEKKQHNEDRFRGKILRAIQQDVPAAELLMNSAEGITIDATQNAESVLELVKCFLGSEGADKNG